MVMHNRGGGGAPHWWDDLPPKVRERFTQPLTHEEEPPPPPAAEAEPPPTPGRVELVANLSAIALLVAAVAVVNILFLLAALSFLYG